jgi:hypothetical protein
VIGVTDCGVYGYLEQLLLVFGVCLFGHYFWTLLCKHRVEHVASFFRICGGSVIQLTEQKGHIIHAFGINMVIGTYLRILFYILSG